MSSVGIASNLAYEGELFRLVYSRAGSCFRLFGPASTANLETNPSRRPRLLEPEWCRWHSSRWQCTPLGLARHWCRRRNLAENWLVLPNWS